MNKCYLISFDPTPITSPKMLEAIKNSSHVNGWWHYLSSTYIVFSAYTLATVQNDILLNAPKIRFLIIEVDATNRNGWLPPKAWEWFKRNV